MATEETELTFIRCPNCRSLVPAVATRCRMCGQLIEQGAEAPTSGGSDALSKKPRVRQRTMSASDSEAPVPAKEDTGTRDEPMYNEPRQDFREDRLPEIPLEPKVEERTYDFSSAPARNAEPSEPVNPRFSSRDSDPVVEPQWEFHDNFSVPADEVGHEADGDDEPLDDDEIGAAEGAETGAEPGAEEGPSVEALDEQGEPRRRRRRRRKKKRGSGMVDAPSTMVNERSNDRSMEHSRNGAHEHRGESRGETRAAAPERPLFERPPAQPITTKTERPERQERDMSEAYSGGEERQRETGFRAESPSPAAEQEGVLVGWFVDYSRDSKGTAREIRTGRFFLSGEQLRPTDMVLKHESVSTPHCLVRASAQGGMHFQDLMSERGTFVRRLGESSFQRINEPFSVESGDSIRFGGVEVTVCLIPSQRRRGR